MLSNPSQEYGKDKQLKKEEVQTILEWVKKQPHLPQNITEFQVILFIQSCYYKNEAAKKAIDGFFTSKCRTSLFQNRNPFDPVLESTAKGSVVTTLPKKTPHGFTLCLYKMMDVNAEKFHFAALLKLVDMVGSLNLHRKGISEGYLLLVDLQGFSLSHLARIIAVGPLLKQFCEYFQESAPLRMKGIHFFNIVPFMDKVTAIFKTLIKKKFMEINFFHKNVEDLIKMVPLECLPKDYGGPLEDLKTLQGNAIKELQENVEFFEWEDKQIRMLDENKRVETFDSFDGSFKKLALD